MIMKGDVNMAIRKTVSKSDSITFQIHEECGVIATRKGAYDLKLRYMSWNGRDPVYDLRPWKIDPDTGEETASKGLTLSGEELEALYIILKNMVEE